MPLTWIGIPEDLHRKSTECPLEHFWIALGSRIKKLGEKSWLDLLNYGLEGLPK